MQLALRPYVTAGVAVVGAGMIAVTPVVAPDVEQRLEQRAVELAAEVVAVDPVTAWVDLFQNTFDNAGQIAQDIVADPFPVVRQVVSNQYGYAQQISTALQGFIQAQAQFITGSGAYDLGPLLEQTVNELFAGNITGAASTINQLVGAAYITPGTNLLSLFALPGDMTANLNNATQSVFSEFGPLTLALLGALGLVTGVVSALGDSGQAFVDAVGTGEPVPALEALASAPVMATDAFLNGYSGGGTVGLLSPQGDGLVYAFLVAIPQTIAQAIGASSPSSGAADPSVFVNAADLGAMLNLSAMPADMAGIMGTLSTDLAAVLNPAALLGLLPF